MTPKNFAVGMTTCPRDESYLIESYSSLIRKSWPPPLVYNDVALRGDMWGFAQTCRLLLSAYPRKDWFLIVQDDVVACDSPFGFREPTGDGVHSLFSTSTEDRGQADVYKQVDISSAFKRKINCDGGCAIMMNRKTTATVADTAWIEWKPVPALLGGMCRRQKMPYGIYGSNVFEHIGEVPALIRDVSYKWDVSKAAPHREK
jgi:hypothetical protein